MQAKEEEYREDMDMYMLLMEKEKLAGGKTYETKKIYLEALKKRPPKPWELESGAFRLMWQEQIAALEYELTLFKPEKAYRKIGGEWVSTDGTHTIGKEDWEDWDNR